MKPSGNYQPNLISMKYLLVFPAVIVFILMRWFEIGAKVFGKINDKFIDYWITTTR